MEPGRPDDEAVAAFARDGVACLRSVLDAELPAGADMDHPLFPVIFPAAAHGDANTM
jgi:hypothetical protein